jgi:hypothetical protein
MIKKLALVVGVAVVGFAGVVVSQPGSFRIERSGSMQAPPEVVFAQLNDLRRWDAWSPWNALDPNMQKTYSGSESGVGAVYAWSGNDDVGSGSMTITGSEAPSRVALDLHFTAPFEAKNVTTFDVEGDAEGSRVSWAMEGKNDFMGKAVSLFMDMDSMVGKDFETGLANLARASEAEAKRLEAEAEAKRLAEEAKAKAEEAEAIDAAKDEADPG